MKELELQEYLLKRFPKENERCEWKEFKSLKHSVAGNESDDIISYISAIANMQGGHLIIGVQDKTLNIVGIQDFYNYTHQNIKLKILKDCTNLSTEGLDIKEYVTSDSNKIVWVINIPKHQYRLPVYAHKKPWQRIEDSLVEITKSRLDAIITELRPNEDWSAIIIKDANINDLDDGAIAKAKIEFKKRNPRYIEEADTWNDAKFLDKAKLTINGKITRTALILLGKDEAEHFLSSTVKIRWNLKTVTNEDKSYEVFSIPLILAVDEVFKSIRNLKYVYLRDGTLFPDEFLRYEPFNIREPLNNAIAHQDYSKKAYINVVEFEDDHLVFSNYGTFLPKSVEHVVLSDTPEENSRNPFLVAAMKNLGMIETQGGGIRKLFTFQRQRFFPMPDYDFKDGKCKVTITGKILNEDFARILIKNPKLLLEDILLLDKVQKEGNTTDAEYNYLKKQGFIEGRKSNPFLSYKVIEQTNDEALMSEYLANKSFDDAHFKDMIIAYLTKFGKVKRTLIDNLIIPKLSAVLSDSQKKRKVGNFLLSLRVENKIKIDENRQWSLV